LYFNILLVIFHKICIFIILYFSKDHIMFLKIINYIHSIVCSLIINLFSQNLILLQKSTKIYLQNVFLNIYLWFFLIKLHDFKAKPVFLTTKLETWWKIMAKILYFSNSVELNTKTIKSILKYKLQTLQCFFNRLRLNDFSPNNIYIIYNQ